MNNRSYIRRVAVLGAGVMGAQIAAHLANAGVEAMLFELAAQEGDPNANVTKAIANLAKLEPSPLAIKDNVGRIIPANYDQHLEQLRSCDLLIEAIASVWTEHGSKVCMLGLPPISTNTPLLPVILQAWESACWPKHCRNVCAPVFAECIFSTHLVICS